VFDGCRSNLNEALVHKDEDAVKSAAAAGVSGSAVAAVSVVRERCVSESQTHTAAAAATDDDDTLQDVVNATSETGASLPPTLSYLVLFWEELCQCTLKKMMENDCVVTCDKSEVDERRLAGSKNCKDESAPLAAAAALHGNLFGRAADERVVAGSAEPQGDVLCELCGVEFAHPVTYHMRLAHPGCGRPAGGQGYNSGGSFCGGWAGSCGDGGVGGSTWYLMCDVCRTKYLRDKKRGTAAASGSRGKERQKKASLRKRVSDAVSVGASSQVPAHWLIYSNAMFVLELTGGGASSTGGGHLSAVSEDVTSATPVTKVTRATPVTSSLSPVGDDSSFPRGPFLYLQLHGKAVDDESDSDDARYFQHVSVGGLDRSVSDSYRHTRHRPVSTYHTDDPITSRTASAVFQRSVSEMASIGGHHGGGDGLARRKGSGETGVSLVKRPSTNMARLIQSLEPVDDVSQHMSRLPVMLFVSDRHELDTLRRVLMTAVRRSACRTYGLHAINWLMRNISQTSCLHQLLWQLVTALSTSDDDHAAHPLDTDNVVDVAVCGHVTSDVMSAGEVMTRPLVSACHAVLQSVSDVLMSLPAGSAVQRQAVRCWSMQFHADDHPFLHRSHVFSHISRILSTADEATTNDMTGMSDAAVVKQLRDVTAEAEIKTSSRQAMMTGLTDGSTETFWESGDEDRNKTRWITLSCAGLADSWRIAVIAVHVDNGRDVGCKVSSILIHAGMTADNVQLVRHTELDQRHAGWVTASVHGTASFIRLELRGPDNTLRVRQVRLLAESRNHAHHGSHNHGGNQSCGELIEQRQCENETLSVFRLLTSLVFGRLVSAADGVVGNPDAVVSAASEDAVAAAEDADLKQHMVGILFSHTTQLTRLQRQVCAHIVGSLHLEAARVRSHWMRSFIMSQSAASDAYCFELLSLLLALSGSSVGRRYVAQQTALISDLMSLLHTASARVQRQVVSLLRRTLSDVAPRSFATLLGIDHEPPSDLGAVLRTSCDEDRPSSGLLDVLLACVAKALSVQLKCRLPGATAVSKPAFISLSNSGLSADDKQFWWLRGSMSTQLAESIVQLLAEMTSGHLGAEWAAVTKCAIASPIVSLSHLSASSRSADTCLQSPVIWLSLAALCVLHQDHVHLLSTGRWAHTPSSTVPSPTCDNHDDGETPATILCGSGCGSLCSECDRVLHLSRRQRLHQRQVRRLTSS